MKGVGLLGMVKATFPERDLYASAERVSPRRPREPLPREEEIDAALVLI